MATFVENTQNVKIAATEPVNQIMIRLTPTVAFWSNLPLVIGTPTPLPFLPMPILFNDNDAAVQWGFRVSSAPGWADTPPRTTVTAAVLRRAGARRLNKPQEEPKRIVVKGVLRGTSVADARTKADAFKLALVSDTVKLSFPDYSGRYINTRMESFVVHEGGPHFIMKDLLIDIGFVADDPLSYDNAPTTVADGARLPLGTGPTRPVDTITGASINPVLTLHDTAGNVIGTLGLTITTVGGDVLIIDHDAQTITKNGVNIMSTPMTGGFFTMDPADPRYQGAGPTITAVVGDVGVHTTTWRKSWR